MIRVRLKYLCSAFSSNIAAKDLNDNSRDGYPVFGASGIMGYRNNYDFSNDYLGIIKDGAGVGRISKYPAKTSLLGTMCAILPNSNVDINWLMYAIKNMNLGESVDKATIPHIYFSKYGNTELYYPDMKEQVNMARYLDENISKIDALIANQQQQIEKLKQYKQSLITEVVTKGLDKNVAFKDSGFEWIGEYPISARILRLKFYSYMKGRIGWQGLKSVDFIDEGPYCITGTDFFNGKVDWNKCYHVSEERYEMDPNIHVKDGDLLVTKDGTIGKLAKINNLPGKACLNSHLLIIRPLNNVFTNDYLYYVLMSDVFWKYYKKASCGSIMDSISQEKMGNFSFPVYNKENQELIISYLDDKCEKVDKLIEIKNKKIDKLNQYKKSLIYEYVTGKKRVPEA